MAKRARYDGPFPAVVLAHPETGATIEVELGHLLPADVPAGFRDSLLEQSDWSEVDQATPKTKEA